MIRGTPKGGQKSVNCVVGLFVSKKERAPAIPRLGAHADGSRWC